MVSSVSLRFRLSHLSERSYSNPQVLRIRAFLLLAFLRLSFRYCSFEFAGLWQVNFAREKNFVNLTWDCYLGNPIKKHSLKKVV